MTHAITIYLHCKHEKFNFFWDDNKNSENVRKHGVSFEEAQTVFFDEKALEFEDPDHSETEDRFLLPGLSQKLRVLVICHCFRKTESEICIISARKATAKEQKVYYKVFK
ncbi:MAG: BrnT family toxin [Desulfosalsimonas sp.]